MINAISGRQQQYYPKAMTKENKEVSEKNNNQYNKSDVYIPSEEPKTQEIESQETEKTEEKELFYGLDDKEWKEFAKKYNVENLSHEEKEKLLTELKDKGVLNEQEYQTTNLVFIPLKECFTEGGEITIGETQKILNLEDTNWLKKFDNIADYCDSLLDMLEDDDRKQNIEDIRDIYLKIADIFDKIAEERKNL